MQTIRSDNPRVRASKHTGRWIIELATKTEPWIDGKNFGDTEVPLPLGCTDSDAANEVEKYGSALRTANRKAIRNV